MSDFVDKKAYNKINIDLFSGKDRSAETEMKNFDLTFYKGKKVLVTGHTGFKGSWLCRMLLDLGAEVTGY